MDVLSQQEADVKRKLQEISSAVYVDSRGVSRNIYSRTDVENFCFCIDNAYIKPADQWLRDNFPEEQVYNNNIKVWKRSVEMMHEKDLQIIMMIAQIGNDINPNFVKEATDRWARILVEKAVFEE